MDDLAPQLAEFDLRCQSHNYDTAAAVLLDIEFDHLILWGHYRLLIELHQRLHGHLTDPWTTAAHLGNLGLCYANLGQISTALDHHQQALTIARDIGHRRGEANHLGNLGNCYADLGQLSTALDHHQQALTIDRDIGHRRGEADLLAELGEVLAGHGEWRAARDYCAQAVQIADEIGYVQIQCEARTTLAVSHLLAGDADACHAAAKDAATYEYAPRQAQIYALLGIAELRKGANSAARQSFATAVEHADAQLQHTPQNYAALDRKALALCGLARTGDPDRLRRHRRVPGGSRDHHRPRHRRQNRPPARRPRCHRRCLPPHPRPFCG